MTAEKKSGLALMREPFRPDQIGKRPTSTCKACSRNECREHKKAKCKECGSYITTEHMHLDFVGHADLTERLLDADPEWNWEPLALDQLGLPALDRNGGLWIRLTVCGVTRLGYGDAPGKTGGNAVKEAIGDALRNAAMRYGAALDLWQKGERETPQDQPEAPAVSKSKTRKAADPQPELSPADHLRNAIREFAVERHWDLKKIAEGFASDYDQPLKSCQDVELLNAFFQQLEEEARAEQEGAA